MPCLDSLHQHIKINDQEIMKQLEYSMSSQVCPTVNHWKRTNNTHRVSLPCPCISTMRPVPKRHFLQYFTMLTIDFGTAPGRRAHLFVVTLSCVDFDLSCHYRLTALSKVKWELMKLTTTRPCQLWRCHVKGTPCFSCEQLLEMSL